MKDQRWCQGYHYIDAFAGPGQHELRTEIDKRNAARQALLDVSSFGSAQEQEDQRQFLAGSPRVALELTHPFSNYVFVEHSPDRIAALNQIKEEYGSTRRIHIRQLDCTKYLQDLAVNPKVNWEKHRAIVFLDPFGMQVGWQTIADLAATKGIEIFLNFPVGMAIQRLLLRKPENFTVAQRQRLDDYFGSPDWITALYRRRQTLFGDEEHEKLHESGETLLKWYRGRLGKIFRHVSKAALIRNTKGGHLYYLLLASHNNTGVKIANDILSGGEVL